MEGTDEAELREFVRLQVDVGLFSKFEIVEIAMTVFKDDFEADAMHPVLINQTDELWAARLEEQRSWPPITDCDKLDAAFQELDNSGIVARQDFTDCQTCGNSEIWNEMSKAREAGHRVRGYTFYHQQDSESATEGYGVFLSYGSTRKGSWFQRGIAAEVCRVLRRHGLSVTWPWSVRTRIHCELDWKRRLRENGMPVTHTTTTSWEAPWHGS
ncbi:MAG: hypothetical protein HZC36_01335 [Armatimonadetes bacterium]|nr:hypothetical protein [Armatimonadota bacterium]